MTVGFRWRLTYVPQAARGETCPWPSARSAFSSESMGFVLALEVMTLSSCMLECKGRRGGAKGCCDDCRGEKGKWSQARLRLSAKFGERDVRLFTVVCGTAACEKHQRLRALKDRSCLVVFASLGTGGVFLRRVMLC
jgi:hypothetical protein